MLGQPTIAQGQAKEHKQKQALVKSLTAGKLKENCSTEPTISTVCALRIQTDRRTKMSADAFASTPFKKRARAFICSSTLVPQLCLVDSTSIQEMWSFPAASKPRHNNH
mmetsp:Transcript_16026/g.43689  ORF Transcript_16026/g.43689 Transcript_16026/m.43689 type:complete len:109 (+) Transcript_16026:81-407(+)|eukprot:1146135-Pelagomonas_calceolata.AAC.2